jgi:XRE family transcriptional regulator, regulator of sulfur utilization
MALSRREMMMLVPALAAAQTAGAEDSPALPGQIYHASRIAYTGDDTKKSRRFFYGHEHSGFNFEMHETVLGPSAASHPPHTHEHEEIIIILEGTARVTIDGREDVAETGSVIYYEPNRPHGLVNAGNTTCRYYVIELRGKNT